MDILNTFTLKSNRQIKINFDRGDLSSDAGLLLIKEFAAKIGFSKLIKKKFKANDKSVLFHKDDENLMQMIYRILSAYFEDDCSDELTLDPVFNAILEKDRLASQPTLSRFLTVWMRIPSCSLMTLTNVSGTSSILSSVRSICFWTWTALCLALMVVKKGKASTSIIRHTDIIRYCAMMD